MKKRGFALVFACLAALLAVGAGLFLRARERNRVDQGRFERGETELRIAQPPGVTVELFRAGPTLDQAEAVRLERDNWLPEGNYFLESDTGGFRLFFPVPLIGYRLGPESDRSFGVTIRRFSLGSPPTLEQRSPWVLIPGGFFMMGDRRNPGERHYVWLTGFFIGALEVTNGEFRRFIQDPDGYNDPRNWTQEGWRWKTSTASGATAWMTPSHPDYRRFGQDELPVVLVTWYEANAYGRWLTRRLGRGAWLFRLPTEAEWEKAARGPDNFDFGLGMRLSTPEAALYNWRKNPSADPTVVGTEETLTGYKPNRYGLYHASGNVAEWTQSVFRDYGWEQPFREDDRNHDSTPGRRVSRGGSWYSATTARMSLAYRDELQPEMSSNDLGFRLAALPLPIVIPPDTEGVAAVKVR